MSSSSDDDSLLFGLCADDFVGVAIDDDGSEGDEAAAQARASLNAATARVELHREKGKNALAQLAEAQRYNRTLVACSCKSVATSRLEAALRRRLERFRERGHTLKARNGRGALSTSVGVLTVDSGRYHEVSGGAVKCIDAYKANQRARAALRIMVEVDGKRAERTIEELEQLLCCIYVIGNCWQSQHCLLQYPIFGYGLNSDLPLVPAEWGDRLDKGKPSDDLYIAKVAALRTVVEDGGWGIFASSLIPAGSFIGEYAGLVRDSETWSNYYCTYRSLYARPVGVDAKEYGCIGRCVNHSAKPNVAFKQMIHREMVRVVIVAISTLKVDEQILVDYGSSYWSQAGYTPLPLEPMDGPLLP
jgi:hypothetical protein